MSMSRWLTLAVVVAGISCSTFAGEQKTALHSIFEARQHLFGDDSGPSNAQPFVFTAFQQDPPEKKSVGLAAVYSLVLPGMGEVYTNAFGSGKYFLIAEGVLWLGYAAFEVYGNALQNDAREFAAARAGVNLTGKDDQFFVDIGNFINVSEYNDKKLRDRDPSKVYNPAAGNAWQWDSDADRAAYRDQRISSDNMFNNRKFVVGAVIINHVASAINAARAAISHNKELGNSLGDLRFKADVMGGIAHPHGIRLTVMKQF